MYSSTLSLTSALNGVRGQYHAPAILPPGKSRYPLYRRLGGPQGWSGQVRKISPPTGIQWDRPARRESLYRLSCLGPTFDKYLLQLAHIPNLKEMLPLKLGNILHSPGMF